MARPRTSTFLAVIFLSCFGQAKDVNGLAEAYSTTYFAPASVPTVGIWRMRTAEGTVRQFESAAGGCGRMESSDGWRAGVEGAKSWVKTPSGVRPELRIIYENGTPVSVEIDGKAVGVIAPESVAHTNSPPAGVQWPKKWSESLDSGFSTSLWRKDGRLQLWFPAGQNRAGAFLATVLLLGFALALAARKIECRIEGILLALIALIGVFFSQSRGALVAVIVAIGVIEICWLHGRGLLSRKRLLLVCLFTGLLAVAVTALFIVILPRSIMSYIHSDGLRWATLRDFPRMMCDAPWGWGLGKSGAAYSDWYSLPGEWRSFANLFSDHLTVMADCGWIGGSLYLLAGLIGFFGLVRLAWVGGPVAPLGVWCVLVVAACFNPVLFGRTMLWLPLASLGLLALDRRWMKKRFWVKPLVAGTSCSAAILLVVWIAGQGLSTAPRICRRGDSVLVNGTAPKIWLVADDDVLGSCFMPKEEVRFFYWANPKAMPVGIVRDLDALGRTGIRRLVLSGRHCAEFLRRFRERSAGLVVPPEIVFLSPGFSAPEIPRELHMRSRITVVLGEFAARYDAAFGADPLLKTVVVKGAELYLPGWMRYFVPTHEL